MVSKNTKILIKKCILERNINLCLIDVVFDVKYLYYYNTLKFVFLSTQIYMAYYYIVLLQICLIQFSWIWKWKDWLVCRGNCNLHVYLKLCFVFTKTISTTSASRSGSKTLKEVNQGYGSRCVLKVCIEIASSQKNDLTTWRVQRKISIHRPEQQPILSYLHKWLPNRRIETAKQLFINS